MTIRSVVGIQYENLCKIVSAVGKDSNINIPDILSRLPVRQRVIDKTAVLVWKQWSNCGGTRGNGVPPPFFCGGTPFP